MFINYPPVYPSTYIIVAFHHYYYSLSTVVLYFISLLQIVCQQSFSTIPNNITFAKILTYLLKFENL